MYGPKLYVEQTKEVISLVCSTYSLGPYTVPPLQARYVVTTSIKLCGHRTLDRSCRSKRNLGIVMIATL